MQEPSFKSGHELASKPYHSTPKKTCIKNTMIKKYTFIVKLESGKAAPPPPHNIVPFSCMYFIQKLKSLHSWKDGK